MLYRSSVRDRPYYDTAEYTAKLRSLTAREKGAGIVLSRYPIALAVTVMALGIAGHRLLFIARLVRSGKPAPASWRHLGRRAWVELREVIGQQRLLAWTVPGLAHAFTFWGFLVLVFTIIETYGGLFAERFAIAGIGHAAVLGFFEDSFSVSVLIAISVFVVVRLRESPRRLERRSRFYGSHLSTAWLVLAMIVAVVLTLLIYRGAQTNTGAFPYGWWAFASHGIGRALAPLGYSANRTIATVFIDLNVVVIAAFLALVVYTKHLHIFLAPLNVALSRQPDALGPLATTPNMDLDEVSADTVFGAGSIENFTWKQLLDFATCTECGRCQSQCPAWATGKPLSPKLVVMALRDELFAQGPRLVGKSADAATTGSRPSRLVPGVIDPDVLWSCTTCGACVSECPVDIAHVDAIVDMRRYQVLMDTSFPPEGATMLRNIESRGDPFGLGASRRLEWTEGLGFEVEVVTDAIDDDVEYLLWTGCAGAFDDRARRSTQALARLLHAAGVRFAVLGPKETCTGDPARRLGDEFLYQAQAARNIETLQSARVRKIVTSCPHCLNSIGREYRDLGGDFEVVHHSQLLAELLSSRRLGAGRLQATVTLHDSCYLGRHNGIVKEPRAVLGAIEGLSLVEMERNAERGFCCGAGGARMWLEESIGTQINLERVREAIGTGAEVVSTACPYCTVMLDDGVKEQAGSNNVEVVELAVLLDRAMGLEGAGQAP